MGEFTLRRRASPAMRKQGVRYYLSFMARCPVTNRLTNRVYVSATTGEPVVAFDQAAADKAGPRALKP